jgi:restriction system protein
MTIPDYPGLMQPVLHTLKETSRDMAFAPLMKSVGARLGLTPEERALPLPSGNGTVFANRLQWALAYLERNGAVEERGGRYRPAGPRPGPRHDDRQAVFQIGKEQPGASRAAVPNAVAAISINARIARERLRRDLLDRIHAEPPEFFERLIIALLLAMGYGCRNDLARHLGRSGDGGVDGAVPQDVLGLDVVYIQAKRYRPGPRCRSARCVSSPAASTGARPEKACSSPPPRSRDRRRISSARCRARSSWSTARRLPIC